MSEYTPLNRDEARIIAAWEAEQRYGHIPTVKENAQSFLGLKRYASIPACPVSQLDEQREEVKSAS